MATALPGEDAIPSAADNMPRRIGLGSWQPDTISRAANQYARGMEDLGRGISNFGSEQLKHVVDLQAANAQSQLEVDNINTNAKVAKTTVPDELAELKATHQTNFDNAAAMIKDPAARESFVIRNRPLVARNQVGVDDRARTLEAGNQIATADQFATTAIDGAVASDDPVTQNQVIATINEKNQALKNAGYITPQEYQARVSAAAKSYYDTKMKYLVQEAEARANAGDPDPTNRIRDFMGQNPLGSSSYSGPVNLSLPPEARALAETISGPESAGKYNLRYTPKGGVPFSGFADHPRIVEKGPEGPSDAAGKYQFLSSTWDVEARKLGLKDFSPANQDAAAWDLAQTAYKKVTGGDLLTALQSHNPKILSGVAQALKGTWPSLPGGSEEGTTSGKFLSDFNINLSKAAQVGYQNPGPFVGLPRAQVAGPGAPSFVSNLDTATKEMNLTPQERFLYQMHVGNLTSAGGVDNADGSRSSLMQTTVEVGGKTYNLPTVWDGKIHEESEALAHARSIGLDKFPSYGSEAEAEARYQQMHAYMDKDTRAYMAQGAPMQPPAPEIQTDANGNVISRNGRPSLALIPDRSKWPAGTDHVQANGDGSFSYVDKDGIASPVPGSIANGAPGLPAPDRGAKTLGDALHPTDHATANLEMQQAIDRINNLVSARQKQQITSSMAEMGDIEKRLISGEQISKPMLDEYRKSFAAAPFPEVRMRFAALEATRNQLQSFAGQTPATVRAKVINLQNDYEQAVKNGDWDAPMKASVLKAANDYAAAYDKDIQNNFLQRAAKERVIQDVRPINPGDPNLSSLISKRINDAEAAAQFFGVAPQYFTKEERQQLKQIAPLGGQQMVDFARTVTEAAGEKTRAVLEQIGGAAPHLADIGRLAALNAPETTLGSLADYYHAASDKNAREAVNSSRISDRFVSENRNLDDPFGSALDGLGVDEKSRTKATTHALMSAEALDNNWDMSVAQDQRKVDNPFYEKNADKAVGAIFKDGKTYGGVATKGWSGYKVVVPNSVKKDDFFTAVGSLTDAELAKMPPTATGEPITAKDIASGRLVAVPDAKTGLVDGLYSLIMPNSQGKEQIVNGQDGKAWRLDMKSYENLLRSRNPEWYLGGSHAPAPMPAPYRGIHGIEPQEAANVAPAPTE